MLMPLLLGLSQIGVTGDGRQRMIAQFADPPAGYRPHTRWWWPGNVCTKEEISWQLREMRSQGIGGVEQISFGPVYEKGNVPYLSAEYFDLLKHTVAEAKALGMSVSLNFGGPGWVWAGDWVPEEDRNQCLLASSIIVKGPARVERALSTEATINPRDPERSVGAIQSDDRLVAVVVGRLVDGVIEPDSLREITEHVRDRQLAWDAPEGDWRVMAFWSTRLGGGTVNHIDKKAMAHYVDYLGARYYAAIGDAFGTTVESLFGDSFEVPVHHNGIYWADSVPSEFRTRKGYDLVRHLPALWWNAGSITPKVRYDVNDVLRQMGMEAFFGTFVPWCKAHGVKSRVQPYGFVTDILEGAGAVDIPELEITAGEKDAVPWFDTRIGPREYVASGAHLYGRRLVTVEAYTYMHWEPFRATLEELKIAGDTFLRAGANRFYNHGFLATPERDITPTRGFFAAIHVSPDNVWWPYYRLLSDYVARCCYLLRQGTPCADVAIYAPTANQWTKDVMNARSWTRGFEWGELGRLLLANGYAFDLVNDDALQRLATFDGQDLRVGECRYRVLLLPNIEAMPVEALRRIEAYVAQGGVAVAIERVPKASCGMEDWQARDREVRDIADRMFRKPVGRDGNGPDGPTSKRAVAKGTTYWVEGVLDRTNDLDKRSSVFDPFLNIVRAHVTPDMSIDFVRRALRANDGLCFAHRSQPEREVYFVVNLQDRAVDMPVGFRVSDAAPWEWNPYTGEVTALCEYEERDGRTHVPIRLAPYESTLLVFERGERREHATSTSLEWLEAVDTRSVTGWTDREGEHTVAVAPDAIARTTVRSVPAPLRVAAPWRLVLESPTFARFETQLDKLASWTELPQAEHFSGTGVYTTTVDLPARYVRAGTKLLLDLGDVGNVAEVILNAKPAGVVWMPGQRLEVTRQAVAGRNHLEIRVTNTLINRVSGLKEFPPVPEDLRARLGRGLHEPNPRAQSLIGFKPLPRSGLLGPVEIHPYRRVAVRLTRNAHEPR